VVNTHPRNTLFPPSPSPLRQGIHSRPMERMWALTIQAAQTSVWSAANAGTFLYQDSLGRAHPVPGEGSSLSRGGLPVTRPRHPMSSGHRHGKPLLCPQSPEVLGLICSRDPGPSVVYSTGIFLDSKCLFLGARGGNTLTSQVSWIRSSLHITIHTAGQTYCW
jgi:hypothetical protein